METLEFVQELSLDIMFLCVDALMLAGTVYLIGKMFFSETNSGGWYK